MFPPCRGTILHPTKVSDWFQGENRLGPTKIDLKIWPRAIFGALFPWLISCSYQTGLQKLLCKWDETVTAKVQSHTMLNRDLRAYYHFNDGIVKQSSLKMKPFTSLRKTRYLLSALPLATKIQQCLSFF